ncbi:hypothetical protein B0H11DRAFT_612664 [Mycena galericulata]|nr:hypothetical protein B0H11DRAFT_612664 [Mycena galericulata]
MSLCLPPRPNEKELRAMSRKEIQALAKKENIKPANASTEKLIKRLLDKFHLGGINPELPCAKAIATLKKSGTSPRQQRRSSRLATVEDSQSNKSVSVQIACPAGTTHAPAEKVEALVATVPNSPAQASSDPHPPGDYRFSPAAIVTPIAEGTKLEQSITKDAHPIKPLADTTMPRVPYPTTKDLRALRKQVFKLDQDFVVFDVASSLQTMARVIPRLERTTHSAREELKTVAWEGYYLEREVVSMMKLEQTLWDGTNVMPPGPARDEWFDFLDDAAKEYDRQQRLGLTTTAPNSDADTDTRSLSSIRQKRPRESDSNAMDETNPSKRYRDTL